LSRLFKSFFRKIRVYLNVSKASGIAKRYFVMNGFDRAYMAERAEIERRLKEMEEAINNNVNPIIFFIQLISIV